MLCDVIPAFSTAFKVGMDNYYARLIVLILANNLWGFRNRNEMYTQKLEFSVST